MSNAASWYWTVGNRAGVVYSAPAAAYVDPASDGGYLAWTGAGNTATTILTDGELTDVLARAGLQGPVVRNTQPGDWGGVPVLDIVAAVQAAGCAITSTGTAALSAHYQLAGEPYETMGTTQIYINAHNQLPNNAPLPWAAYDKAVSFDTPAEFSAVYQGLQDYFQAWKTWSYHGGTMPAWAAKTIA